MNIAKQTVSFLLESTVLLESKVAQLESLVKSLTDENDRLKKELTELDTAKVSQAGTALLTKVLEQEADDHFPIVDTTFPDGYLG